MKNEKVQVAILKELLKPDGRVVYKEMQSVNGMDLDKTMVIPQGEVGYVLSNADMRVDLIGAQITQLFENELIGLEEKTELKPTDVYRIGGKAQKFLYGGNEDCPVFIDTKLLANFDNPTLYQGRYAPVGVVTIAEYDRIMDKEVIVGLVCPCRIDNDK